jgi:hypothetical protein
MEHRLVMEKHLGRSLEPWEAIHHKDGDKTNNDIGNLEIVGFAEHAATHHKGTRRSTDTKRSIQLFGQMTKALKDERQIKSELLEALKEITYFYMHHVGSEAFSVIQANAAIARAEGK